MGHVLRDEAYQWDRGLFNKNIWNYFYTCLHVYNNIYVYQRHWKQLLRPFKRTGLVLSGSSAHSRGTVCSCFFASERQVHSRLVAANEKIPLLYAQGLKLYFDTRQTKGFQAYILGLFGACCLLYISVYSAKWIEWYLPNKSLKWSWWMFLFTFFKGLGGWRVEISVIKFSPSCRCVYIRTWAQYWPWEPTKIT